MSNRFWPQVVTTPSVSDHSHPKIAPLPPLSPVIAAKHTPIIAPTAAATGNGNGGMSSSPHMKASPRAAFVATTPPVLAPQQLQKPLPHDDNDDSIALVSSPVQPMTIAVVATHPSLPLPSPPSLTAAVAITVTPSLAPPSSSVPHAWTVS